MIIKVTTIGGICFGIEFLWAVNVLVIDLGILRFYFGVKKPNE